MSASDTAAEVHSTFTFAVDVPIPPYDPWQLPYFKPPEGVFAKTVKHKSPLTDIRREVLGEEYSVERARKYLEGNGFTVFKHSSTLLSPPYGRYSEFQDVKLVNEAHYPEVEDLVKAITGCRQVFITDSMVRGPVTEEQQPLSDASFESAAENRNSTHKSSATPPTRLVRVDTTPPVARQMIRNRSPDMAAAAASAGIIHTEDRLCISGSSLDERNRVAIEEHYSGPGYELISVWRPLWKIHCDPLAMLPFRHVENDPDFVLREHHIKQPGFEGDWLREVEMSKRSFERGIAGTMF
jgi:hypothetical protein